MEENSSAPERSFDLAETENRLLKIEGRTKQLTVELDDCIESEDVKDSMNRVFRIAVEMKVLMMEVLAIKYALDAESSRLPFVRKMSCIGLTWKIRSRINSMIEIFREWIERIKTVERRDEVIKKLKGLTEEVEQKEKEFDIQNHR